MLGSYAPGCAEIAIGPQDVKSSRGKLEMRLAGGWARFAMGPINERYIDGFARQVGILGDHLSNGLDMQAELSYDVRPTLSVAVSVGYLRARIAEDSEMVIRDDQGYVVDRASFSRSLSSAAVCPGLGVKLHSSQGARQMFLRAGLLWCFGRARLELDLDAEEDPLHEDHEYAAQGLGGLVSFGGLYDLTGWSSLGVEFGYRRLSTGDLEEDGEEWVVDGCSMNLEFTGPYLLATVLVSP